MATGWLLLLLLSSQSVDGQSATNTDKQQLFEQHQMMLDNQRQILQLNQTLVDLLNSQQQLFRQLMLTLLDNQRQILHILQQEYLCQCWRIYTYFTFFSAFK